MERAVVVVIPRLIPSIFCCNHSVPLILCDQNRGLRLSIRKNPGLGETLFLFARRLKCRKRFACWFSYWLYPNY